MTTLNIFAGDALSRQELHDEGICAKRLDEVVEAIANLRIAGIQKVQRVETACTLILFGDDQALQQAQEGLRGQNLEVHLNDGRTMCRG